MKAITVRNVNDAYKTVLEDALSLDRSERWRWIGSRLGDKVLEYQEPFATTYRYPRERVLFNTTRDANPFFHVMESLWILQGREDLAWISQFNSKIADFSDDKVIFHGAYGFRLRKNNGDQVAKLISLLSKKKDTRRGVLMIWDPSDLGYDSLDIPCNTTLYFKIRDEQLHMTVCCRSNDVIWGAYGANAVHFSFLQEYIASMLHVDMGTYTQISDSFHIYDNNPAWLRHGRYGRNIVDYKLYGQHVRLNDITPLVSDYITFDYELQQFFEDDWDEKAYYNDFFSTVAVPIRRAWDWYKERDTTKALNEASKIASLDWRFACSQWLNRRLRRGN